MEESIYHHRVAQIINANGQLRTFSGDPGVFAVREMGIILTTDLNMRMFIPWNRVAYLTAHPRDISIWNGLK